MQWQKLSRVQSDEIIDKVSNVSDGTLFSSQTSEAECLRLPFYRNYMLYRVTNYATLPSFTLKFLGDGDQFYPLDGSPYSIMIVNSMGSLAINDDTILDYLEFFLENVSTDEGDIYLIRDLNNLPFYDALAPDQQAIMSQRFTPIDVDYNILNEHYLIRSDIYYGGTLMKALITVTLDGQISFSEQSMIGSTFHKGKGRPDTQQH